MTKVCKVELLAAFKDDKMSTERPDKVIVTVSITAILNRLL